jgi:hypothetical protein
MMRSSHGIAAAAGVVLMVGCGASSRPAADGEKKNPISATPNTQSSDFAAAASAAPASGGGPALQAAAPAGEDRAPSPPVEPPSGPPCRVETAALTCISRACFGRPDRKTGPSGFMPVQIRFDPSGEIAAFEPERDEPEWRGAVACARGCVERTARPRGCQTHIYLHSKDPKADEPPHIR